MTAPRRQVESVYDGDPQRLQVGDCSFPPGGEAIDFGVFTFLGA